MSIRIRRKAAGNTVHMLTLFLRAVFLDLFVLLILRLTGKRQVSDLQPYDLLMTLIIADLASTAIADTDIPLLYSVVPMRRIICGTPQILILDGVLQEKIMRRTNYTVRDLLDNLRSKDIFDVGEVAYAILETNGSLSVLEKAAFQQPNKQELDLPPGSAALSHLLILEGKIQRSGLETLHLSRADVERMLKEHGLALKNVFFAQMNGDGNLHVQLDRSHQSRVYSFSAA